MFDNDIMSSNYDVIVFFIYGQFGGIWKPDSGCIVCKTYSFINSTLQHSSHTSALSKGTILAKNANSFAKEVLISAKLREPWY